jgi:hypothetical protein
LARRRPVRTDCAAGRRNRRNHRSFALADARTSATAAAAFAARGTCFGSSVPSSERASPTFICAIRRRVLHRVLPLLLLMLLLPHTADAALEKRMNRRMTIKCISVVSFEAMKRC